MDTLFRDSDEAWQSETVAPMFDTGNFKEFEQCEGEPHKTARDYPCESIGVNGVGACWRPA